MIAGIRTFERRRVSFFGKPTSTFPGYALAALGCIMLCPASALTRADAEKWRKLIADANIAPEE